MKLWNRRILFLGTALAATLVLLAWVYHKAYRLVCLRPELRYIKGCDGGGDSLMVHWTFERVEGYHTPDGSGRNNHGVLGSLFEKHRHFLKLPHRWRQFALPKAVSRRDGKALHFDGENWVSGGNNKCYTTDKFTVAIWVWRDSTPAPRPGDWLVPTIAAKSNWPASGWWLCTQPNTNYLDFAVSLGDTISHVHSGYEIPAQEWHHFAVTVDKVANEVAFYVDGKLYGERHANVVKWLTNWDQNLFVGDYDGTARWPWFGSLDDFRYYRTLLSEEDIAAIYRAEAGSAAAPGRQL